MKKMNLPNKLTILRILLTPILIFFMVIRYEISFFFILTPFIYLIVALLFIAIAITDYIDGYIARRDNLITDFGKLFDPIADKIFVFSVLLVFVKYNLLSLWLVIILLSREFVVVGVRTLIAEKNANILPANDYGKLKTACQMFSMLFIILFGFSKILNSITMIPAVIFSIISMFSFLKEVKVYLK